jgi:hypothetical protein
MPKPVAALVAAVALAALASPVAPARAHQLAPGMKLEDPAECAACHRAIHDEWAGSMHAKSSKFGDPVHGAVHDANMRAVAAAGKRPNYFCASCHAPTADDLAKLLTGEATPDPANPTHVRGVTCSFCHKAAAVVDGERFKTYVLTEGLKGRSASGRAPHGVTASAFASSSQLCMGCHARMLNARGAVICSADQEGLSDCLTCHMARAPGAPADGSARTTHAFHGMHGAHDPAVLRQGATLALSAGGGRLQVVVKNPNPHFFPAANPLRVAFVKVEVFGRDGVRLFTNFEKEPSEDPQALFQKVFRDGDRVGVPTWEADGVARDTRLRQHEERTLAYPLPAGAARATARLSYRFVPAPALEKFGIKPDGTVERPHLVAEAALALE